MIAPPQISPWQARHLCLEQERARTSHRADQYKTEMLRRLQSLAQRGHCSPRVVGWVQAQTPPKSKRAPRRMITLSDNADGRFGENPALRLRGIRCLRDDALLTFCISVDDRRGQLLGYSVGVQGLSQDGTRSWYARVDLHEEGDEDLRGDSRGGYCNHPLLHCHTGTDPGRKEEPEVRAPLFWLMPWEALEWLLATVDPALEPEPRGAAQVDLDSEEDVAYWCDRLDVTPNRLKNLVREVGPLIYHIKSCLTRSR